jgi:deoxyribonucleoside regulator
MSRKKFDEKRIDLLADIAEMYYLENMTQEDIAKKVGGTRSMISKLIKLAYQKGIVKIKIERPIMSENEVGKLISNRFGLKEAFVLDKHQSTIPVTLLQLGAAGAFVLKKYLSPNCTVGVAWGSSVKATIDSFETDEPIPIKAVQLLGEVYMQDNEFYDHGMVQRFAKIMSGEGYNLTTPLVVESKEVADSLKRNPNIKKVMDLGRNSDVVLAGIGAVDYSDPSHPFPSYLSAAMIKKVTEAGAIGNVCVRFFSAAGKFVSGEFDDRIIGIMPKDLLAVPVRIGVAMGSRKVNAIISSLKCGFINVLVTDLQTANEIISISN